MTPFYMTLQPTGDEIVIATFEAQPRSSDPEDAEAAVAIRSIPDITARIWKGTTLNGNEVEVAIVRLVKIHRFDLAQMEERFVELQEAGEAMEQLPDLIPVGRTYPDGVPCDHPGCLRHITHPCEGCGRVEGRSPRG